MLARSRLLMVFAVLFAVVAVASAQAPAAPSAAPLSLPQLLARLTDTSWLHRPPAAGERCVQWSSYDRKSDRGPANKDEWYANDDRGQYLRVDDGADGKTKEYVMCETAGPGVIARIWSANPSGMLHFDIDGARVWSVDFAALCSGQVAPIVEPLAGMHSKGGNCYLPIAFEKSLKVTATAGDLYYHVDVWFPPKGTAVASFLPAQLTADKAAIDAAVVALGGVAGGPTKEPDAPDFAPIAALARATPDAATWAPMGIGNDRCRIEPGQVVEQLTIRFDPPQQGEDLGALLRAALLVVRCGDEETVRVPLLDFFGCGPAVANVPGVWLRTEPGRFTCRLPMPMPTGGEVAIERNGGLGLCDIHAVTRPLRTADDLLFRASFHLEKGFPSRPFRDFTILDASGGPGRFVGCALLVKNPHRAWWGEGDEKFTVDGERFPSWFGTGTEDYFGYAWCCPDPFSSAFHAQPQCDGPANYGFTAVHRLHILDSVPFTTSFRFDLEVWHWVGKLAIDYAAVAYWYAAPGARSGLPDVPAPAARTLDPLPPPKHLVVADAIEGESLKVTACSGGKHVVQDVSFVDGAFSREQQLWWMDGKPGDTLTMLLPVPAAGRYRVRAAFAKARDYAIVQCAIAGKDMGTPIDLFSDEVAASGPITLGEVDLAAGEVPLLLRIIGHNEHAEPRHMIGLDYLLLEPVR